MKSSHSHKEEFESIHQDSDKDLSTCFHHEKLLEEEQIL